MAGKSRIFVLVHGAWWGGDKWWQGVADPLRAAGHTVLTPCLTGLGYRAHLCGPGVDLSTHIEDIVSLIEWEDLTDIILVGHSYGGMVISGVAERLPPGSIRSIVYLDAFLPEDGQSLSDIAANIADVVGDADPVPAPLFFAGGNKALEEVLIKYARPHPRACFFEKPRLTGARDRIPIKTYVLATRTPQVFGRFAERVKSEPSWRLREIDTAHFMMIERPAETAQLLLEAAD